MNACMQEDLDPRIRTAKATELEALQADVVKRARAERERTLAVRYHKVGARGAAQRRATWLHGGHRPLQLAARSGLLGSYIGAA